MEKLKDINSLTLREFELYTEMLKDENDTDIFGIMELFGIKEPENLPTDKFTMYWDRIKTMSLSMNGIKTTYIINGKRFKAQLNILNLKAGQFIDLQNYLKNYKLHEVLSIFLIPQYKTKWFGKWSTYDYNNGYDLLQIQEYLYENMLIGEASELAAFFLKNSQIMLKTIANCSERKLIKMKIKKLKELGVR